MTVPKSGVSKSGGAPVRPPLSRDSAGAQPFLAADFMQACTTSHVHHSPREGDGSVRDKQQNRLRGRLVPPRPVQSSLSASVAVCAASRRCHRLKRLREHDTGCPSDDPHPAGGDRERTRGICGAALAQRGKSKARAKQRKCKGAPPGRRAAAVLLPRHDAGGGRAVPARHAAAAERCLLRSPDWGARACVEPAEHATRTLSARYRCMRGIGGSCAMETCSRSFRGREGKYGAGPHCWVLTSSHRAVPLPVGLLTPKYKGLR
jgi:hypothetical protein